jgi:hypothetical protein
MTTHGKSLAALLGAAMAAGVSLITNAAASPYVPSDTELGFFGGTRDEVLAQCKRVGLVPVAKPAYPGVDPDASARLEASALRALQTAGLDAVASDSYTKAFDRLNQAAGGIFDPMTGAVRRDVAAGVYQGAVREFFEQEHLGCIATLRVVKIVANDSGGLASWDGAVESVEGQAPRSFSRISAERSMGTASAISVSLQLYNREQKLLYARRGGVQLTAYYDPRMGAQSIGILAVPRAQLLMDEKRIERGLRFATVPLHFSAQEIAAGDKNPDVNTLNISPGSLPLPPPGSNLDPELPLLVPRAQILNSVHRVVLGPLFPNGFMPPTGVAQRYQSLIHERLAKLGWDVIDSDSLNLDAKDAVNIVDGIFDPVTGKVDPGKVRASYAVLIKRLSLRAAPDAIVFIGLTKVTAAQKQGNAAWDGAEQNAQTLGAAIHRSKFFGGTQQGSAGEATISAMSLHVLVRDANGAVLYEKRGGIQLLQKMSLAGKPGYGDQHFTNLGPADLFKDPESDVHAVDIALKELMGITH